MARKPEKPSQGEATEARPKEKAPSPPPFDPLTDPALGPPMKPAATIGGKPVPFTSDDLFRFDLDKRTAVLRRNLDGARWEKSSARIEEAESALLKHVEKMLGIGPGGLSPERRALAVELFGKPLGS